MSRFWLCFVPLFVAVDAIGLLPLFVGLTEGMDPARVQRIILESAATAAAVALAFLAAGPAILRFLGITVPDFTIAGGALLFALSLADMITGEGRQRQADPDTLGAVPLGVPLLTGPAVLTTCVLLTHEYGRTLTAAAVVLNIALAAAVLRFARPIARRLGASGAKTLSKIASLLLASIAVMLIRRGVLEAAAAR